MAYNNTLLANFEFVRQQILQTFPNLQYKLKLCPSFFRVNSSLHATIVSCMCVYAMLYEEELEEEPIW